MIDAHPANNPVGSLPKAAKWTGCSAESAMFRPAALVMGQYGANFLSRLREFLVDWPLRWPSEPGHRSRHRSELPRRRRHAVPQV